MFLLLCRVTTKASVLGPCIAISNIHAPVYTCPCRVCVWVSSISEWLIIFKWQEDIDIGEEVENAKNRTIFLVPSGTQLFYFEYKWLMVSNCLNP